MKCLEDIQYFRIGEGCFLQDSYELFIKLMMNNQTDLQCTQLWWWWSKINLRYFLYFCFFYLLLSFLFCLSFNSALYPNIFPFIYLLQTSFISLLLSQLTLPSLICISLFPARIRCLDAYLKYKSLQALFNVVFSVLFQFYDYVLYFYWHFIVTCLKSVHIFPIFIWSFSLITFLLPLFAGNCTGFPFV